MCKVLELSRSLYYYHINRLEQEENDEEDEAVISAFKESRNNYGSRKIKKELEKRDIIISRRRIRQIMMKHGLISNYQVKQYNSHKIRPNQDLIENELDRNFDNKKRHQVIVSDLTYVSVANKWHYICVLLDLFNREIIGHSVGPKKDSVLVKQAFMNANIKLSEIELFHTDRGSEFKNIAIEEILTAFGIRRSLSNPGCPYDNAVAEALYKIIKTEFVRKRKFGSLEQLKFELFDYINWYNTKRIHGSLGYLSPVDYRLQVSM